MSAPPIQVAENEMVLFFQTNRAIPASAVAHLILELERVALKSQHLGADGLLEVVELQTGTMWLKVAGIVGTLGSLAGMVSCSVDVADQLKTRDAPIARCVAHLVEEYGVVSTRIINCEGGIDVAREMMPAVSPAIKQSRSHAPPEKIITEQIDKTSESRITLLGQNAVLDWAPRAGQFPPIADKFLRTKGYFVRNGGKVEFHSHGRLFPVRHESGLEIPLGIELWIYFLPDSTDDFDRPEDSKEVFYFKKIE
jgi:hypothetical protein